MVSSYYRGHKIIYYNDIWFYEDNKKPVSEDKNRKCSYCQKENTKEGHDGCIGELSNVKNACCGHGNIKEAYVQFNNGICIRGEEALYYLINNKQVVK
jgi:hypothetical protein